VAGRTFSVHAEGERVILTHAEGERKEIELVAPPVDRPAVPDPVCPQGVLPGEEGNEHPSAPGVSALDRLTGGNHE
jgi:hypothetical protein